MGAIELMYWIYSVYAKLKEEFETIYYSNKL